MIAPKIINTCTQSQLTCLDKLTNIDILVCARQYEYTDENARGYGDIAHAVRVINLLQKHLLSRDIKIAFAVEYSGATTEEIRINKLANIENINYLLISRYKNTTDIERRGILANWINSAKCIIHGPSKLISNIAEAPDAIKSKTIVFEEYGININYLLKNSIYNNMTLFSSGFYYDMLHLPVYEHTPSKFDNTTLQEIFSPLLENKQLSTISPNNNPVYFAYNSKNSKYFLLSILRNILLIEKNQTRNVYLISTVNVDKTILGLQGKQENADYLKIMGMNYKDLIAREKSIVGADNAINIMYKNSNNEHCIICYPPDSTITVTKTLYFIKPQNLTNNDFTLANIISSFVYATGDISCSDALSHNKIPFLDPDKKHSIFNGLLGKLAIFCKTKLEYAEFSRIWKFISYNFSMTFNAETNITDIDKKLNSNTWLQLQREFTSDLRKNNQLDDFILDYVKTKIDT